jgi:hypothetical protein
MTPFGGDIWPSKPGHRRPNRPEEENHCLGLFGGRNFLFGGQRRQSLPLPFWAETTIFRSGFDGFTTMERTRFEPFGEQLVSAADTQPKSRGSKLLLRVGTGLFWSLVAGIVFARAAFFEPGVYDGFSRVASLAKSLIF